MPRTYYVRHGAMRHVGRFAAEGDLGILWGKRMVVRSRRGEELGEVLAEVEAASMVTPRVLRAAAPTTWREPRTVAEDRSRRLAACERFFRDGEWPLELIDVEPMLDEGRTVVLYLGPHKLDASGLAQALRDVCGLDAIFEPIGLDAQDEPEAAPTTPTTTAAAPAGRAADAEPAALAADAALARGATAAPSRASSAAGRLSHGELRRETGRPEESARGRIGAESPPFRRSTTAASRDLIWLCGN